MSTLLRSYSQVFLVLFLQVQILFYILSSCATSQVRRAVSLSVCIVPVNCKHCCLEEDSSRPTISFPWAVLCVVDYLSLILVGHSKGKTHETMKRRQVHHTWPPSPAPQAREIQLKGSIELSRNHVDMHPVKGSGESRASSDISPFRIIRGPIHIAVWISPRPFMLRSAALSG